MIHQRAVEIADEIRLTRSQHSGSFLVVEGRDDRLFMQNFTDRSACNIVVAEGKENVCTVVSILDDDNFTGVLGLIDADFDRIENVQSRGPNILMPEYHDLETMLLCSSALDRVLAEFGSQEKLATFEEEVLEGLLSRALPLGYLRLYSARKSLNLRFDGMTYSAWVDRASFDVRIDRLINEVKNRYSKMPAITPAKYVTAPTSLKYFPLDC